MYYDNHKPNFMNFGGLGTVIARELSNMFLDGRNYDAKGEQIEYTTSESLVNYYRKIKCHGEQFIKFYIPEIDQIVSILYFLFIIHNRIHGRCKL